MHSQTITNFGRNVAFTPCDFFTPASETEVVETLDRCRGRKIRVVGRLHSWSELPVAEDVLIDLQRLNEVRIERRGERVWVTVGAGCQIKRLLAELERQEAGTMPSLGLITEQSIAGAMATGTHGSGRNSLSHYADEIRIAGYDPATGQATIRVVNNGDELRAARCSLGALGVVVSIGFWARPAYRVEEHFAQYDRLDDILAREAEHPLQQFYLIPWQWKYFAQHRRETDRPHSRLASAYRWYFHLVIDWGLHLALLLLVRWLRSAAAVRFFFRNIATQTVIRNWHVVDRSQDMLIMEHELFRHIETEIFVQRSKLADALSFAKQLIRHCDGDSAAIDDRTRERLQKASLSDLDRLCGRYTHHYMICVRRVLPDDTLISMASGAENDEAWHALSFVSYASPAQREGFFEFAAFLARATAALFGARPHWGKYCPLPAETLRELYPNFDRFRQVCEAMDAEAVFRNRWISDVMQGSSKS